MAEIQMNLRIEESLDHRLDVLAKMTGRSKAFYAAEAIEGFLDDCEDEFLARDALSEFRSLDGSSMVLHEQISWDSLGK